MKGKKKHLLYGIAFVVGMFVVGFAIHLGVILFGNYAIDDKQLVMNQASVLFDKNDEEITKLFIVNRELVSIDEIPDHVQHAFIAVEDHRFFSHQGIDFRSIGRALYRDLISGDKSEGGSTITQQLAKNVFLSNEKTWLRKTKEALIAINLERRYSKIDILEMYLNRIYFGHGVYGIQAASKYYFGKTVDELTVEEGALLAAIPKAPSTYSPFTNKEKSKERRDLVLSLMEKRGYLSAEEAVRFQGRALPKTPNQYVRNEAYLSYIDLVLNEAENKYGLTREEVLTGGYRIIVEMDPQLQRVSYEKFQDDVNFPDSMGENDVEGSLVMIDHHTGGVVAVQGGRNYVAQGFHRVYAKRQPGSIFKPIAVYAPALETGEFEPYSLLKDELLDYDGYIPKNYNNSYRGEVTMYDALRESSNAAAVWLLDQIGIDKVKKQLANLGLHLEEEGLALALGGLHEGITPMEVATLYSVFANGGYFVEPYFIREIYDHHGRLVAKHEIEKEQIISPQTAWYMTRMLEAVVNEGTATQGEYEGALAGKTGTTSFEKVKGANRDIWFAGFTPEITGVVWMGYDRTDENHYLTVGSSVPTKLFKNILSQSPIEKSVAFKKPAFVNDLEDPIRLVAINDLSARATLSFRGANIHLHWTGSDDDRVQYRIYKVTENGFEKIDEVIGVHEYTIRGANIFSLASYVVVPYNPQIEREGEPSNVAKAEYSLFSQEHEKW